jgi:hypothetical protein
VRHVSPKEFREPVTAPWGKNRGRTSRTVLTGDRRGNQCRHSTPWARFLRCACSTHDISGDVRILDRANHHQIDFATEQTTKLIEHFEVVLGQLVGIPWSEIHQEVDVAFAKAEVIA